MLYPDTLLHNLCRMDLQCELFPQFIRGTMAVRGTTFIFVIWMFNIKINLLMTHPVQNILYRGIPAFYLIIYLIYLLHTHTKTFGIYAAFMWSYRTVGKCTWKLTQLGKTTGDKHISLRSTLEVAAEGGQKQVYCQFYILYRSYKFLMSTGVDSYTLLWLQYHLFWLFSYDNVVTNDLISFQRPAASAQSPQ